MLPLLRLALCSMRYRQLSTSQQRVAWHASRALASALKTVLLREPAPPPESESAAPSMDVHYQPDTLLLLKSDVSDVCEGGDGVLQLLTTSGLEEGDGRRQTYRRTMHAR